MTKVYRTLRVAPSDKGVLSVVIDAPPMNLIGPELVRDLVTVLSELESDANIRVMVLESADPDFFIPHVWNDTRMSLETTRDVSGRRHEDVSAGYGIDGASRVPARTGHRR